MIAPSSEEASELRPPYGGTRSWLRRHPLLLDGLLALVLDAWVLVTLRHLAVHNGWWPVVFSQLLVLPLAVRRRYPWPVFLMLAFVAATQWLTGVRLTADVALLVALYTVAAHCSRRLAWTAAFVLEAGVILASVRFAPTGDGVLASTVFLTGMVAAALFSGITLRTRRQYLSALTERAVRLERERDQQAQLAATAERTRIAREMHDVVTHSLSVIITLADAAVLAHDRDPEQAREAMAQVAATGRMSMTEMRGLLGVLRSERSTDAALSPQPSLAHVDALMSEVRAAGLPVTRLTSGQPQPLTSTQEAAIYRIVQECLTNTIKHADQPSLVRVTFAWSHEALTLEISDDGRGPRTPAAVQGLSAPPGHGMIGMRERAGLFQGSLLAGPAPGGGWRVQAILPLKGVA
ncbi:MAG TPA: sensor histidine kinase [Jatrophihabitans sp.]|nr:sensor histidine kinase [Jatrophihabitans sp.]